MIDPIVGIGICITIYVIASAVSTIAAIYYRREINGDV